MYYVIYNSYAGTYATDIYGHIRHFYIMHLAKEFMREHMLSKVYETIVRGTNTIKTTINTEIDMTVGSRIKQIRKFHGIKRRELVEKIGISENLLKNYENNESMIKNDRLSIIAQYFGVTTDFLMSGKATSKKEKDYQKHLGWLNEV